MKKWLLKLLLGCFVLFFCSAANAATVIPNDSYWMLDDQVAGVSFTLFSEDAGYADVNIFGLYQNQGTEHPVYYEIFSGGDTPFDSGTLSGSALESAGFLLDQSFGFYLDSTGGSNGGIFTSDPLGGHDNNGVDHMLTSFDGSVYTLSFEDLVFNNSENSRCCCSREPDFNDMVINVSGMTPTPLPGALFLLLGGIPFVLRKRM
jgi:hypothetical protein